MNNQYLQERLVELKQQELQRELEQARLLREAGLSGSQVLARAVVALRNLLVARRKGSQEYQPMKTQSYPSLDHKLAP